jgi:hypothetical protein
MVGLSSIGEARVIAPLITNVWVSLHTLDPANNGGSEVVGGGYVRQGPVPFLSSGFNPTIASNNAILTYPAATANWGTVNFFGLWDALSAGNFLGSGAITLPIPIQSGDTARFYANTLTVTVD